MEDEYDWAAAAVDAALEGDSERCDAIVGAGVRRDFDAAIERRRSGCAVDLEAIPAALDALPREVPAMSRETCERCHGRGWFDEVEPGTENDYIPGFREKYCDCPAGDRRMVADGFDDSPTVAARPRDVAEPAVAVGTVDVCCPYKSRYDGRCAPDDACTAAVHCCTHSGWNRDAEDSVDLADEILAACDAVAVHRPRLIVSGGQTGADRAGLDAAMALGIGTDGFCPRGRLAEDGRVPDRYNVRETGTANYGERTALNVRFSDATIIFHYGMLSRGSKLTERLARKMGKARLVVKLDRFGAEHVDGIRAWLNVARPEILNVAGQRESRRPGIGAEVERILRAVWA
jgi:hypothetical protein